MVRERIIPSRALGAIPPDAGGTGVAPFQFVLDGTESLRVFVLTKRAPIPIQILLRMLRPDGTIHVASYRYVQSGIGNGQVEYFKPGPGAIMNVSAFIGSGGSVGAQWADCHVTVGLSIGQGAAAQVIATLVQSYITTFFAANWPGTPFRSPNEGPGRSLARVFNGALPGLPATIQGQSEESYRLSVVTFTLTTSAVPGNRRVAIVPQAGNVPIMTAWTPVVQPAGSTWNYAAICGGFDRDNSAVSWVQIALPPRVDFNFGDNITITAIGLDPADQFPTVTVYGERWIDPT